MSDTSLPTYLHYGTNAERLAFVPDPPIVSGTAVPVLYVWYETDTGDSYGYDTTWHLLASVAGISLAASKLLGRGSAGGTGIAQAITLGTNLTMTGTTLDASGGTGTVTHTGSLTAGAIVVGNGVADVAPLASLGTTTTVLHGNAAGLPTFGAVALAADVSGDLPLANLVPASGAAVLLGRGSAAGAGDFQELTISTGLTLTGTVLTAAGTGAPSTAQYVALATDATLTNERVLTGTTSQIVVTDNGAGSTVVLSTPQNLATTSTPQFARTGLGGAADSTAVAKFVGQYYSPLVADGNSGTTKTLDFDAGNEHYLTLTGNVTLTLTHPKDGGRYVILLNSGAGAFTVTWPASGSAGGVKWPGGTAPVITVTAAKVDLVTLIYSLTDDRYYGSFNQNY